MVQDFFRYRNRNVMSNIPRYVVKKIGKRNWVKKNFGRKLLGIVGG